jgi:hypothetical protein
MNVASKEFCGWEASTYLPSKELLEAWNQEARGNGYSLSKYIFEI